MPINPRNSDGLLDGSWSLPPVAPDTRAGRRAGAVAVAGVWLLLAVAAAAGAQTSQLVTPAAGAVNVATAVTFQWTPVSGAAAYYLYVGTAAGLKDVVNTGETQQTSHAAAALPASRALYARSWVKHGGVWRYTDSTFTTAAAPAIHASLTAPANGAAGVPTTTSFQWTSVAGAEAYVLYVGRTIGARDIFGTSETLQTMYKPGAALPAGETLFARTWVRVGGVWRSSDSAFTTAAAAVLVRATLTAPLQGATGVDTALTYQWTSAAGAQAYVLYVGSTAGANDLQRTNESLLTSAAASSLPGGRTVYTRLWTKLAGVWGYVDSTFTTKAAVATMVYPADGATGVDVDRPFSWTPISGADKYTLWVGTTPGTHDVANSAEITGTSYPVSALPGGVTGFHVTVWTRNQGVWQSSFSTFQPRTAGAAAFLNPIDGQLDVDLGTPVRWTPAVGADGYELSIGTSRGGTDVLATVKVQQTSFQVGEVPSGKPLFARLRTRSGASWRYADVTFTALPFAPRFIYPAQGAAGVSLSRAFEWTRGQGADAYYLWVGTTIGSKDLVNTGEISGTSYTVSTLPAGQTLYARVYGRVNGSWSRYTEAAFTLSATGLASKIVFPADAASDVEAGRPFEWAESRLAGAYRLTVGSATGLTDLHDSGEIKVTRRFVEGLPIGRPLFGRVYTRVDGQWHTSDFTFSVLTNQVTTSARIEAAQWATSFVRAMTPAGSNRPYPWTLLWDSIDGIKQDASCGSYTQVLMWVLDQMNLGLETRRTQVRFTQIDVHVFAEVQNRETSEWILVDPTFDLSARRRSDGGWASAADIARSTLAQDWDAIEYVFLGPQLGRIAAGYYLDYPLLFLNDFVAGSAWHSALPYLNEVALPSPAATRNLYILSCDNGSTATVVVSGTAQVMACASDGLSGAFLASSVAAPAGSAPDFHLYQPRWFVFGGSIQ